jgi:putative acetyltransferase
MISFLKTDSNNLDFIQLSLLLDKDIAERMPDSNEFFSKHNKINLIKHVIVVYINNIPVSCGAIKKVDDQTMEIKRMYTSQEYRRQGIGQRVLNELETWTAELLYTKCILQTGVKHKEAIELYKSFGYVLMNNYSQYSNDSESICFEKKISN